LDSPFPARRQCPARVYWTGGTLQVSQHTTCGNPLTDTWEFDILQIDADWAGVGFREYCEAGGLAAYGVNFPHIWRRAAAFVDKILKGTKPADLPIEQATRFEFIINLRTAKTLGLEVPATLLARADEVIE
jgi:ABC transporter substrate binding protein